MQPQSQSTQFNHVLAKIHEINCDRNEHLMNERERMTLRPLTYHQSNESIILKRIFVFVGLCFEQIVLSCQAAAPMTGSQDQTARPCPRGFGLSPQTCFCNAYARLGIMHFTLRGHWEVERPHSLCHELLLKRVVFLTHVDHHVYLCALLPGRVHRRRELLQAESRGAGSRQDGRPHDALVEPAAVVKAGHRGGEVTRQAKLTHTGDLREETHF